MKLHFLGAAREVTGTCYLLESGACRLLVDCGLYQGNHDDQARNHNPFPFDPREISAVLLTHAHMDHIGRVPLLVKRGFKGPIYASAPSCELAPLLWHDMVTIMEEEAKKEGGMEPIYDTHDVQHAAERLEPVEYHQAVDACAGVFTVTLHDAGHILGSSSIAVRGDGKTIVFSGDLGNDDMPILRPTERLAAADVLVIESTYGDRVHEDLAARKTVLRDLIRETHAKKGTLVIPAFAIERSQEIMVTLHRLAEAGEIPRIPVFMDSPLAIEATRVYEEYPQYYNADARKEMLMGHDIFSLPGFTATKSVDASKEINTVPPPKVVISGAGMMTGGRIHHHLQRYLPDPNSTLLIVGYQARHTLGRRLYEGADLVRIHGVEVPVKARVVAIGGWSAHADQAKLLRWVGGAEAKPKRIFVTHGEDAAAETLARKFSQDMRIPAEVPAPGDVADI